MSARWMAAIVLCLAGCRDHGDGRPQAKATPVHAAAPAPPRPKPTPPPLPAGRCCCEASLKGDQLVQILDQAACTGELAGACVDAARCWLPDPPAMSP
jgi:hypothetical protein